MERETSAINEKTAMGQNGPSHRLIVVIVVPTSLFAPVHGRIVFILQGSDSGGGQRLRRDRAKAQLLARFMIFL